MGSFMASLWSLWVGLEGLEKQLACREGKILKAASAVT